MAEREYSEKIPKDLLKEWLYLKHTKGITDLDISKALGINRVTVTNYFTKMKCKKTNQIKITNYLKTK